MEHPKDLAIDDRRQASRFRKERGSEYALVLQADGSSQSIEVHDESLGGLALRVENDHKFWVGQELELVYLDQLQRAIVRHVSVYEEGYVVVGLECTSHRF